VWVEVANASTVGIVIEVQGMKAKKDSKNNRKIAFCLVFGLS
jgi:hypothetical protein